MDAPEYKSPTHSFNIYVAKHLGSIGKAIILKELYGICKYHKNNNQEDYFKEGKWWCYYSATALCEDHIYLKKSTVTKWLKEMEKEGLLERGSFNKYKFDTTSWYAVNMEKYAQIASAPNIVAATINESPCLDSSRHATINESTRPSLSSPTTSPTATKEESKNRFNLESLKADPITYRTTVNWSMRDVHEVIEWLKEEGTHLEQMKEDVMWKYEKEELDKCLNSFRDKFGNYGYSIRSLFGLKAKLAKWLSNHRPGQEVAEPDEIGGIIDPVEVNRSIQPTIEEAERLVTFAKQEAGLQSEPRLLKRQGQMFLHLLNIHKEQSDLWGDKKPLSRSEILALIIAFDSNKEIDALWLLIKQSLKKDHAFRGKRSMYRIFLDEWEYIKRSLFNAHFIDQTSPRKYLIFRVAVEWQNLTKSK